MKITRRFAGYCQALVLVSTLLLAAHTFAQEAVWVQGFTGTPFFSGLRLDAIAHRSDGGIIVGGAFSGDMQVGTGDEVITIVAPTFNDYLFVACFNATGQVQWVQSFMLSDLGELNDLTLDDENNIYVVGELTGNLELGDDDNPITITSTGYGDPIPTSDGVVFKLSPGGGYLWHRQFTGNTSSSVNTISTTAGGNLLLAIRFQSSLTLSDAVSDTLIFGADMSADSAIAEYTSEGEYVQVITVKGDLIGGVFGLTEDAQGDRYASGYFLGEKVIEAPGGDFTLQAPPEGSSYGSYVFKYSPEGELIWLRTIHGTGQENAFLLAPDFETGQLYVGGFYDGTLYVENEPLQDTITSYGTRDMFVLSFSSDGELQWSRGMGGAGDDLIYGLQTMEGGFAILGSVGGDVFFDHSELMPTYEAPYFGFGLVGYNENGDFDWAYFRTGDGLGTIEVGATALASAGSNSHYILGGNKNVNFGSDSSPITFENPAGPTFNAGYLLKVQSPIVSAISESASDANILLYPVPAKDYMNLELKFPGTHTMEIRNIQGQLMDTAPVREGISKINLAKYASGTYIIMVYTDSGWGYAERFIVAK